MYLVPLKTALVEALRQHFSVVYANQDFANLWISIEYPNEQTNYPGVWINYEDSEELARAGIDQREYTQDDNGDMFEVTRWIFQGEISFTCAALTSRERDNLFDELVRTVAFAGFEGDNSSVFRNKIEENDFIAMNTNFDTLRVTGDAASPGTPWGTGEIIYEKTVTVDVRGEFVSDPGNNNALVKLAGIQVMGYREGTPAPAFPDDPPQIPPAPPWTPNDWT